MFHMLVKLKQTVKSFYNECLARTTKMWQRAGYSQEEAQNKAQATLITFICVIVVLLLV